MNEQEKVLPCPYLASTLASRDLEVHLPSYLDGILFFFSFENLRDIHVPSARLTLLHSTKLCTNFKIFRNKYFLLLRLPLRHF
jgi:hypothetical protein